MNTTKTKETAHQIKKTMEALRIENTLLMDKKERADYALRCDKNMQDYYKFINEFNSKLLKNFNRKLLKR
jgi:hypothetical protein